MITKKLRFMSKLNNDIGPKFAEHTVLAKFSAEDETWLICVDSTVVTPRTTKIDERTI